jgi:hypothetical protein
MNVSVKCWSGGQWCLQLRPEPVASNRLRRPDPGERAEVESWLETGRILGRLTPLTPAHCRLLLRKDNPGLKIPDTF